MLETLEQALNTHSQPPLIFDRRILVRHRERAALASDIPDFLLQHVAEDVTMRLGVIKRMFPTALCFSAATGAVAQAIRRRPGTETVMSSEMSQPLARRLTAPALVLDEEALPLRPGSVDLAVSALTLQFVNDLPGALAQICQILRPDGLFLGALLGGATLTELRQSALAAEEEMYGGASPRVAPFADVRDLGGLLQRAGFALPVTDSDTLTVTYPSPLHLMRELKAMGASNILIERRRTPVGRHFLMRIAEIYAERFSDGDGRVPATFEILTMTGWAPHESQQQPLKPGSARSRLADALGVKEKPTGEKPRP